jgi:hypothetical protein
LPVKLIADLVPRLLRRTVLQFALEALDARAVRSVLCRTGLSFFIGPEIFAFCPGFLANIQICVPPSSGIVEIVDVALLVLSNALLKLRTGGAACLRDFDYQLAAFAPHASVSVFKAVDEPPPSRSVDLIDRIVPNIAVQVCIVSREQDRVL